MPGLPNRSLLFAVPLLIVAFASSALAAPLAITRVKDLSFGSFVGGSGYAGSVTVDPAGTRSSSGTVRLMGGVFSPAQFTLSGTAGTRYTLTLPASVTMTSGTTQLMVTSMTSSIATAGSIPAGGTLTFTVGGTATVNSTQGTGSYSGSFDVSVARN